MLVSSAGEVTIHITKLRYPTDTFKQLLYSNVSLVYPPKLRTKKSMKLRRFCHDSVRWLPLFPKLQCLLMIIWLVVSTPLKNISQLGLFFPIYGKIKFMFQTTNQLYQPFLFLVHPPILQKVWQKSLLENYLQSGAPLGHLCRKPRLGMTWTVTPYGGSPGYPKATQKSSPNSWLDGWAAYPYEKYESQLESLFPIDVKIKFLFQTTNQMGSGTWFC